MIQSNLVNTARQCTNKADFWCDARKNGANSVDSMFTSLNNVISRNVVSYFTTKLKRKPLDIHFIRIPKQF